MPLLIAVEKFDLGDILLFFLDDIGISTYCRGVIATTPFLFLTTPKTTSLAVLFLFANLGLMDKRLLGVFTTRYVSGRGVNKHILSRIFLFLFCRFVSLETLGINLSDT